MVQGIRDSLSSLFYLVLKSNTLSIPLRAAFVETPQTCINAKVCGVFVAKIHSVSIPYKPLKTGRIWDELRDVILFFSYVIL